MILKLHKIICALFIALQISHAKQNATVHLPAKKSNLTLPTKTNVPAVPQQIKRTLPKVHKVKSPVQNATTRQMNLEGFVENHKEAIVRLLKKLLLPKLKARALQYHHKPVQQQQPHVNQLPIESDPTNGNLDKEAMNYELGYFLGLQKAYKNRHLGVRQPEPLVPLRLRQRPKAVAVSNSGPMTGYTSVSMPFHKMMSTPVHESLQTLFNRYGVQDPGFVKKVTRADERDILTFAGKHNMDVFAEKKNVEGLSDYLAKRGYISKPLKVKATNEGTSQRIKKDGILGPSLVADVPDKPEPETEARTSAGPDPLEHAPTPLHKMVSQADHISADELHGLLKAAGGKVNWDEISGLIGEEQQLRQRYEEEQDKTPEVGRVDGEDTQVAPLDGPTGRPSQQEVTAQQLENMGQGLEEQSDHDTEKRTLGSLLRAASGSEYDNRRELRDVLQRIISRLSEMPEESYTPKRSYVYDTPYYQKRAPYYNKRGFINSGYAPYYAPLYTPESYSVDRYWKRSHIPRPGTRYVIRTRENVPQDYKVETEGITNSQEKNYYDYESQSLKAPDLESTGGVEAYALPKIDVDPQTKLENYVAAPHEESYQEAISLLNRGSSIDDSLGDHLQGAFLSRFILPNANVFKKSALNRLPASPFRYKLRLRRSNINKKFNGVGKKADKKKGDVKQKATSTKKQNGLKKKTKKGKKKAKTAVKTSTEIADSEADSSRTLTTENAIGSNTKGSKKHEILRQNSFSVLSGMDSFVAPAVYESTSENFFTQGDRDGTRSINQLAGNVLISGAHTGIGTATGRQSIRQQQFHQPNRQMLEAIISNPRMSGYQAGSYTKRPSASRFVGNRQISPVLDIYKDHSVSANGDTPIMEVQNLRQSGVLQNDLDGSQNGAVQNEIGKQNEVDTQGQGSIEMSNKVEIIKSPSANGVMEAGNFNPANDELVSQQTSQIMEEPKGDEQTGVNSMTVEEVSGDAKQAISNAMANLDKQGLASDKTELEKCCIASPGSQCCEKGYVADAAAGAYHVPIMTEKAMAHNHPEVPYYDSNLASVHPLSDQNLVQTMSKASKGLDDEIFAGTGIQNVMNKGVNHVFLPNEDFDGIDWSKIHAPVHGPQGYNAHSKEDIQILSDPFFSPGVGEPIGDHGKPGVIPPSLIGHPINHLAQATNNTPSITLPQLSVVDAQNAHAAVLTADAVNTLHALTPLGTVQSLPTVTAGAAQAPAAAAGAGLNAVKPSIPVAAVQSDQKATDGGTAAAIAAANAGAAAGVTSVVNTNGIPTAGKTRADAGKAQEAVKTVEKAVASAAQTQTAASASGNAANVAQATSAMNTAVNALSAAKQEAAKTSATQANSNTATATQAASVITTDAHKITAEQINAHHDAVDNLHKEIFTNAEHAAVNANAAISSSAKNATTAHYIADVTGAAAAKIKDNNEHAAELHQLANKITEGNEKITAKANEFVGNAGVIAQQELHTPVSHMIGNATTDSLGHVYSSNDLIHTIQAEHSKTVDDLEAEANRVADLHHDSIHMGTYLNHDAIHSVNPVAAGSVLSHDHVDADMHTPVVYGDWHTVQEASHHHDAYPNHWNRVELDSHEAEVDMTPMTPGGIHFANAGGVVESGGHGVGLPMATGVGNTELGGVAATGGGGAAKAAAAAAAANAASANTAAANKAAANSAAAGAVAATGASGAAEAAAALEAAKAARLAGSASTAGLANSAATSNAVANAITSANAASANGGAANAAAANAAAANAAAANTAKVAAAVAAGSEFATANKQVAKVGTVGGVMDKGKNEKAAAATKSLKKASTSEFAVENKDDGYPDVDEGGSKKRNMTESDENFDNDGSKKAETDTKVAEGGKTEAKTGTNADAAEKAGEAGTNEDARAKEAKAGTKKADGSTKEESDNETNATESSGLDVSAESTANVEEGSEVKFEKENDGDFTREKEDKKDAKKLDGNVSMDFSQSNSEGPGEDATGAETEKSGASEDGTTEKPQIDADDKTTSLEAGNLKDAEVQNFTDSATVASEDGTNFVADGETGENSPNDDDTVVSEDIGGMEAAEEIAVGQENGESRSKKIAKLKKAKKAKSLAKGIQKGAKIQSEEATKGNNEFTVNQNLSKVSKKKIIHNKKAFSRKLSGMHSVRVPSRRKIAPTVTKARKPLFKTTNRKQQFRKPGTRKLKNRSNFQKKVTTDPKLSNSSEFFISKSLNKSFSRSQPKPKNTTEFFLIKTNNLSLSDPKSEEDSYGKEKENVDFVMSKKLGGKTNTLLDDFQLSDAAKKHLLPGDKETLSKLHRLLSIAQLDLLKKKEPEEENANTRMLKPFKSVSVRPSGRSMHRRPELRKNSENKANTDENIQVEYRNAIHEALQQIEGVKKSLTKQESQEEKVGQTKYEKYREAIHSALKEVEAVKKSLMQSSSSKVLANALAISNLANLLRQSTQIFNSVNGYKPGTASLLQTGVPGDQVTANIVTGGLLSPGASGVLINPAGTSATTSTQQTATDLGSRTTNTLPEVAKVHKSTKDIYAEIGTQTMDNEDSDGQNEAQKKSTNGQLHVVHEEKKAFRTIKEMRRR